MADPRFQPPYSEPPYPYGANAPYPTQPPQPYPPNVGSHWEGEVRYPYAHYNENPYSNQNNPHNNNVNMEGGHREDRFTASNFSDKKIRHGFIRKVYLTLSVQLLFTFGIVCVFCLVIPVRNWIRRNPWFYYLAYAVFLVTYLVLGCIVSVRRKVPGNYICLTVFTLALSYMAGSIGAFYGAEAALIAVALTFALCICITLFATQTRIDFTLCSGLLFVFSCAVMLAGIAIMIVYFVLGPNKILQGVYGGVVTLLFGLYLAYDTQQIMGGREFELEPEEYIFGAMQLYVDVVFMFMAIAGITHAAS
ncbi:hypothetical protein MN116_005120 [Schistosoma mekongi]|uniref:Uncharacterized protein n=1 Tax=Schistosoma mekongi TaxID=38744 RepID=A0AAE1ZDG7_SCHME|nr:hypothetical protein MN116_005120 [Schistosoma mekongi]